MLVHQATTNAQDDALYALWTFGEDGAVTARELADAMVDLGMLKAWNSADIAHGRLVKLWEKRLVQRAPGRPALWSLTSAGHDAVSWRTT